MKIFQILEKLTLTANGENIILRRGDRTDAKDINYQPIYNSICI